MLVCLSGRQVIAIACKRGMLSAAAVVADHIGDMDLVMTIYLQAAPDNLALEYIRQFLASRRGQIIHKHRDKGTDPPSLRIAPPRIYSDANLFHLQTAVWSHLTDLFKLRSMGDGETDSELAFFSLMELLYIRVVEQDGHEPAEDMPSPPADETAQRRRDDEREQLFLCGMEAAVLELLRVWPTMGPCVLSRLSIGFETETETLSEWSVLSSDLWKSGCSAFLKSHFGALISLCVFEPLGWVLRVVNFAVNAGVSRSQFSVFDSIDEKDTFRNSITRVFLALNFRDVDLAQLELTAAVKLALNENQVETHIGETQQLEETAALVKSLWPWETQSIALELAHSMAGVKLPNRLH